ncbi:MAG TPA: hypothetical protein VH115_09245, partial [Solirubrobacteraceae bacterium]|nr:hypothetical protein [Solirubrobacteraceae bacterium]
MAAREADVAVIGGGVVGCAVARALARGGVLETTLLLHACSARGDARRTLKVYVRVLMEGD